MLLKKFIKIRKKKLKLMNQKNLWGNINKKNDKKNKKKLDTNLSTKAIRKN